MVNHIRRHHPELLPRNVSAIRSAKEEQDFPPKGGAGGSGAGDVGAPCREPPQSFSVLAKALSGPRPLAFPRPFEDTKLAVDYAVCCVLGDLSPVNSVVTPGMQAFLARYAKAVLTRAVLSAWGVLIALPWPECLAPHPNSTGHTVHKHDAQHRPLAGPQHTIMMPGI